MVTQRKVLFVCLHGSAKSLIAAEYFNRLAAARGLGVRATSAGTEPDAEIPPRVAQGLRADGIDVEGRRPRRPTPAVSENFTRARDVIVARVTGLLEDPALRP